MGLARRLGGGVGHCGGLGQGKGKKGREGKGWCITTLSLPFPSSIRVYSERVIHPSMKETPISKDFPPNPNPTLLISGVGGKRGRDKRRVWMDVRGVMGGGGYDYFLRRGE